MEIKHFFLLVFVTDSLHINDTAYVTLNLKLESYDSTEKGDMLFICLHYKIVNLCRM